MPKKGKLIMATKKAVEKKVEFKMEQVCALWKQKSKSGNEYFSGSLSNGVRANAFYNTDKKNPKEPDLRIYPIGEDKKMAKEPVLSMWVNVSKTKSKYLTGKLGEKRVVGFINNGKNEKAPYISIYFSTDRKEEEADQEQLPF